jgi:hypothetical protein
MPFGIESTGYGPFVTDRLRLVRQGVKYECMCTFFTNKIHLFPIVHHSHASCASTSLRLPIHHPRLLRTYLYACAYTSPGAGLRTITITQSRARAQSARRPQTACRLTGGLHSPLFILAGGPHYPSTRGTWATLCCSRSTLHPPLPYKNPSITSLGSII